MELILAFFKLVESHIRLEINEEQINEKINNVLINVELNSADSSDLVKLAWYWFCIC